MSLCLRRIFRFEFIPEARRPGGPEARRPGGPEARRPGGPEARRPGGPEARRLSPLGFPDVFNKVEQVL